MGRTCEQSGSPAAEPEFDRLQRVYAQQTPESDRPAGEELATLPEVARSHRALAARRVAGKPLIQVLPQGAGSVVEIVTDDMPYLVESVLAGIGRVGGDVRRLVHPIVVVRRTVTGELLEVLADADPADAPAGAFVESWIHLDLAPLDGRAAALEQELRRVLQDVREVVEDGERMARRACDVADELLAPTPAAAAAERADVAELLRWLADGNFTFLGYRHYTLSDVDGAGPDRNGAVAGAWELHPELASGLGVLRRDTLATRTFAPKVEGAVAHDQLIFTRASVPSRVLRPVRPYYVGVRTFDAEGRTTGEHRFLGMLTVAALHENVLDIPLVARRVRAAIHRAGFPLESYSGQRMLEVISGLPREELFSASEQTLHDTAVGVLALAGRRAVRVFLHPDPYRRFMSCLVYLPRDRYTTSTRLAMADVLRDRLGGREVGYTARVTEASLALVHFTVYLDPAAREAGVPSVDVAALQDELTEAIRTWDDRLADEFGGEAGPALLDGIPESYKAVVTPAQAVEDLRRLLALEPGAFDVRLYSVPGAGGEHDAERRFTLYLADAPVTLTAILPVLQSLGVEVLDERPSEFVRPDGRRCWLYDFGLRIDEATLSALPGRGADDVARGFCSAFAAAWRGETETDRYSALVLRAGLGWREAAVLRAYGHYARQLGSPFGPQYMADVLLAQPDIARGLINLFRARFDPSVSDAERGVRVVEVLAVVSGLIDEVAGLDADRILRGYLGLVTATVRTNWFRGRGFFSFKFDPGVVAEMPVPRPWSEVFV
ncbi:NAD-glutamate dehydrogenase, partial [Pseudonocardia bannensis]